MTTPPLNLEFPPTTQEYSANIRRQKACSRLIAYKLRRGIALREWESAFAAAQLTARAADLSEAMPKKKGRPPKMNYSDIARDYVLLVQSGTSKTKAKDILATRYGAADVDTIDDAIARKGKAAEFLYGVAQGKK